MLLSSSRTFSQAQEITETELYRPLPSNPAPLLLIKYLVAQLWAFFHKGVTAGLHWRSLSSSPCVKSPLCKYSWCSSSVQGAIFWSEDAKTPGCMEITMFVWRTIPKGVLGARTWNPYKQRYSLSNASAEAWPYHFVELSRKSIIIKLQLLITWSWFFYFGLIFGGKSLKSKPRQDPAYQVADQM